jgi:hypothetical protein
MAQVTREVNQGKDQITIYLGEVRNEIEQRKRKGYTKEGSEAEDQVENREVAEQEAEDQEETDRVGDQVAEQEAEDQEETDRVGDRRVEQEAEDQEEVDQAED